MQKCYAIIRSSGIYESKDGKTKAPYDNYIFYLSSGGRYFSNEQLIKGEGKPTEVKIKKIDYDRVCDQPIETLFGKELHFWSENGELSRIEIK